jgi:alcohol dehydrogenase (cytochrome c)
MYYPLQNACMNVTASTGEQSLNSLYGITTRGQIAPGTDTVGTLHAISVETGADAWKYEQRAGMMSAVTTGGWLVFAGDANGRFRAFDQESGRVLWEVNLGSAVTGYPMTYAVDGRQFVAVSTGNSLVSGAMNRLTPELSTSTAPNLYVFALPEGD